MKKQFLKFWFWLFPKQEINSINKKLEKAVVNKKEATVKLIKEVGSFMINDLKIDTKSKFIPLSVRRAACTKVMRKYGKRMVKYKIKINFNLELVQA